MRGGRCCCVAFLCAVLVFGLSTGVAIESLTIMSYNIRTDSHWAKTHGGDWAAGRTWRQRISNVARTINIASPDILGIQEGLENQIEDLTRFLPSKYRLFKGEGRGKKQNYDENEFCSIIYDTTRVEHVEGGTFWLSKTPEIRGSLNWNSSLPRIATWSFFRSLTTAGETLGVINTHFDHSSEVSRANSAAILRMKANELFRSCNCLISVTADFNAPKSERWYSILTSPQLSVSHADVDGVEEHRLHSSNNLLDCWTAAKTISCGSCSQSTYHAWLGSKAKNHLWIAPTKEKSTRDIALAGSRHIDGILYISPPENRVDVVKAKMLTDDKRIRYAGGPPASDHYPVFSVFEWATKQDDDTTIASGGSHEGL